jgi:hypothetical protein
MGPVSRWVPAREEKVKRKGTVRENMVKVLYAHV